MSATGFALWIVPLLLAILVWSTSENSVIGGLRPGLGISEKRLPKVGERRTCLRANSASL